MTAIIFQLSVWLEDGVACEQCSLFEMLEYLRGEIPTTVEQDTIRQFLQGYHINYW